MARNSNDQDRYRSFTRRAAMLGMGQLGLFSLLAGRLYYLQVVESDRYVMLAEDNRINVRLLAPPRGLILDRFGRELASNEPTYRAIVVPEQTNDLNALLDEMSRYSEISEAERDRVLREAHRKRSFLPITVKENLTWEEVSRIEVNAPDLPGVTIEAGETRSYPYGVPMSHIVGYVSAVSEEELTGDPLLELPGFRIGKSGIEKSYDTVLRGSPGNRQVEVNAVGRVIRELSRQEGVAGKATRLTIDAGLQAYAYGRLSGERSASSVVLDVETGDVLALANYPSFDPTPFTRGLTQLEWDTLVKDPSNPLSNKATRGAYAPGSTFKMIVALAALEMGIDAKQEAFCPGYVTLGNARFHCWKRWGHGKMDMHRAIRHSCDVYFYELSKKVGIDRISDMAKRLGLGLETGIDLPGEKSGLIPTRGWKISTIGEPWQMGETLITAIGQGFVTATPLQLAVMTARLASGLEIKPKLLQEPANPDFEGDAPPASASLNIPERHLEIVRQAMDAVTNDQRGTAYRARIAIEGQEMAGKTGTSQVRRISMAEREAGVVKNEDLPWRRRDHALFVAYAPVEKPRYCCSVVVEHGGGGSTTAAPIARDILIEAQRRDPLGKSTAEQLARASKEDS